MLGYIIMMACFRKAMVFVCLINLLLILCISFVTGDDVNDDDTPLPDLKFKMEIRVYYEDSDLHPEISPNQDEIYDVLKNHHYKITFTIANTGNADAKNVTVNFKMVYYDVYDYEIKEHEDNSTIIEIKAGKNGTIDFFWSPLRYLTLYTVIATIDPDNFIPEVHDHYTQLEWELFESDGKPEDYGDVNDGEICLSYNFLGTFCPPWSPFLIVICSLLIYFIFRWRRNESKQ